MVTTAMPNAWKESRRMFKDEGRFVELEKLNAFVDRYIAANWQWHRFAFGGLSVVILAALAFTEAATAIGDRLGGVPGDVVLGGAVFAFVCVFEIWMWLKRATLKAEIRLLDTVGESYLLMLPNTAMDATART